MANIFSTIEDGIGWLVLANPGRHNALTQAAWEAIPAAVNKLKSDGARCIIVCGEGDSFCAGADISEFDTVRKDAASAAIYEKANAEAFAAIAEIDVPTIAAISGYCLGGGFGIASACDLRIATKEAQFSVPAARLGLAYPVDAMADIVAAIGRQNTKHMLFTAKRFSASDMLDMDFLLTIVTEDDVREPAKAMAQEIVALAPLTHAATKAAIESIATGDTKQATKLGNTTFTSVDYAEGRAAFREKRAANFKGR